MARTRTHDRNQKPFTMPDTETKPVKSLRGVPPQSQQDAQIMSDENKRTFAANLIDNLIESYRMPKVQSNRELEERAINYLRMCSEKRIPPTWEGLALFCEVKVRMTPDRRELIKAHAAKMEESTTEFINRAIDEAMERDNRNT